MRTWCRRCCAGCSPSGTAWSPSRSATARSPWTAGWTGGPPLDLAGRLAAQVSGVVTVHNAIGYDVDDTSPVELDPVHPTPIA